MAYLHIILVRRFKAGCGVLVAFMVTNSETRVTLQRRLKWLKVDVQLTELPMFMIDYSVTEVAKIRAAFDCPKSSTITAIFFLHHLVMQDKRATRPLERRYVDDFTTLIRTNTILQFTEVWERY